jgi:hypothetical protein
MTELLYIGIKPKTIKATRGAFVHLTRCTVRFELAGKHEKAIQKATENAQKAVCDAPKGGMTPSVACNGWRTQTTKRPVVMTSLLFNSK